MTPPDLFGNESPRESELHGEALAMFNVLKAHHQAGGRGMTFEQVIEALGLAHPIPSTWAARWGDTLVKLVYIQPTGLKDKTRFGGRTKQFEIADMYYRKTDRERAAELGDGPLVMFDDGLPLCFLRKSPDQYASYRDITNERQQEDDNDDDEI